MRAPSCMALVTTFYIFNLMPGLLGLKDVEIKIPKYIKKGDDVRLTCNYDLENEALYTVKWYKGLPFKEFFRFIPKESPASLAFNMPGLYVDATLSNDREVLLRNASFQTSGLYKCSVAAEFPFETLEDTSEMNVVVIGDDAPRLRLDTPRSQFHPGDLVSAECQSPPSFPTTNISWYLNDIKVDSGQTIKTELRKEGKDIQKSTVSTLSLYLPEKVPAVPVRIYCRATVFAPLYDKKSNITTIHYTPRRLTGTDLLHSGSSRAFTFLSGLSTTIISQLGTLFLFHKL